MTVEYKSLLLGKGPSITLNDRTQIRQNISKYWQNQTSSMYNIQYLDLNNGVINIKQYCYERTDIFVVQFSNRCNIFVEADGQHSVNVFENATPLTMAEDTYIELLCEELLIAESNFVETQRLFFGTQPWLQLEGLTPDQAIVKLKSLGW